MGSGIEVSPDMDVKDALAHYGVKGMQWGKRKSVDSNEIGAARLSAAGDRIKLAQQAKKMNNTRNKDDFAAERAKYAEMKTEFLKNPDRATQLRLTTGEKVVLGLMAVALPGIGTGVAAGTVAGRVGTRKVIEAKQRRGSYDN